MKQINNLDDLDQFFDKLVLAISALESIVDPIGHIRKQLKDYEKLDGISAINIAERPEFYQNIARKALDEIGELMLPTVFLSGEDKVDQFQKELKALLSKYDAEMTLKDFGRAYRPNEKIIVNFNWDVDLANRTNTGIVPDWIVGRWENGK